MIVQNYNYHAKESTKTTEIQWLDCVTKNETKEKYNGTCVGSGEASDVVACDFKYTEQTAPAMEEDKWQAPGSASGSVSITTAMC